MARAVSLFFCLRLGTSRPGSPTQVAQTHRVLGALSAGGHVQSIGILFHVGVAGLGSPNFLVFGSRGRSALRAVNSGQLSRLGPQATESGYRSLVSPDRESRMKEPQRVAMGEGLGAGPLESRALRRRAGGRPGFTGGAGVGVGEPGRVMILLWGE